MRRQEAPNVSLFSQSFLYVDPCDRPQCGCRESGSCAGRAFVHVNNVQNNQLDVLDRFA
jgi:hypothetical protein